MRTLTAKQKKLLDQFFDSRKQTPEQEFITDSVFKDGKHNVGIEDLFKYDDMLYAKLEQINDTEILYNEVDRYLNDKSSDWVYNRNNKKR